RGHGLDLQRIGTARRDDRDGYAERPAGVRQRLAVIAGRRGDDAALRGWISTEQIQTAADLEGRGRQGVLALEQRREAELLRERFSPDQRRRADVAGQEFSRGQHVVEADRQARHRPNATSNARGRLDGAALDDELLFVRCDAHYLAGLQVDHRRQRVPGAGEVRHRVDVVVHASDFVLGARLGRRAVPRLASLVRLLTADLAPSDGAVVAEAMLELLARHRTVLVGPAKGLAADRIGAHRCPPCVCADWPCTPGTIPLESTCGAVASDFASWSSGHRWRNGVRRWKPATEAAWSSPRSRGGGAQPSPGTPRRRRSDRVR